MSESVYKVADHGPEGACSLASDLAAQLPGNLVTLSSIQWTLPHVGHQYMLGESSDALYCVFMGTKFRRDLVTNANVPLKQLWSGTSGIAQSVTAVDEVGHAVEGFVSKFNSIINFLSFPIFNKQRNIVSLWCP